MMFEVIFWCLKSQNLINWNLICWCLYTTTITRERSNLLSACCVNVVAYIVLRVFFLKKWLVVYEEIWMKQESWVKENFSWVEFWFRNSVTWFSSWGPFRLGEFGCVFNFHLTRQLLFNLSGCQLLLQIWNAEEEMHARPEEEVGKSH